ncbi:MAG: polyprenyl synthetase family protein [Bifidobacterium mongoliense]|jgi:geranylgeranyl diphosphate synthase type I|uniref:polyprenyl synthetase family protein n=1 Tax=Bifidobacterium mongoliense TaxID=518643 RepID=UPI002F35AFE4
MNPHPTAHDIEQRMLALLASFLHDPDTVSHLGNGTTTLRTVREEALWSSAGGKRIRALLAYDAFHAISSGIHSADQGHAMSDDTATADQSMLDLACAIEVYQTSALIHDDIIDESAVRRGRPSAHRHLSDVMADRRQGSGLALMLGNTLATASVAIAHEALSHLPNTEAGTRAFLDMQHAVQIGQMLDLSLERMPLDSPKDLVTAAMDVDHWKTASYTAMAPLELGALAGGMEPVRARRLARTVGTPLGLAFQLYDDLLDIVGSSARTGKPTGGDIREGKRTVLLADALNLADEPTRIYLTRAFTSATRDDGTITRVMAIYEDTGAIDASRRRIDTLLDDSIRALHDSGLDAETIDALSHACSRVVPRTTNRGRSTSGSRTSPEHHDGM